MKLTDNSFKTIILIIGGIVIAFDVLLYHFCEEQKIRTDTIRNQLQEEVQSNGSEFKDQQQEIMDLRRDLENLNLRLNEQSDSLDAQKGALLQEAEKMQQIADEHKNIQTSLVDIKAEADAIKDDMNDWQKDYVSVLAQLEKKMDDSRHDIKLFENNLKSLNIPELKASIVTLKSDVEKLTQSSDNTLPDAPAVPDKNHNVLNSN